MAEKNSASEDDLINGCISRKVWEEISSSVEDKTPEEVEASLDPDFVPLGWLDSEPPPWKKLKLCLSKNKVCQEEKVPSSSRFADPVSEEELTEAAKGVVPSNTKKNNCWAERTFNAWVEQRNKVKPNSVPTNLLTCHDSAKVCKYMRCFVLEARTQEGKKYPPGTIRSILSGLNRIMKDSKAPFSILDKANPCFLELQLTLDTVTSTLHREGVGVSKKSALVISFEHEDWFREKRLLGYDTPKALQRAFFFVC